MSVDFTPLSSVTKVPPWNLDKSRLMIFAVTLLWKSFIETASPVSIVVFFYYSKSTETASAKQFWGFENQFKHQAIEPQCLKFSGCRPLNTQGTRHQLCRWQKTKLVDLSGGNEWSQISR